MSIQWIPAPNLIPELPTAERSVEFYSQHWYAREMAKVETTRQGLLVGVHEVKGAGFVLYRVPLLFSEYVDPTTQDTILLPRK